MATEITRKPEVHAINTVSDFMACALIRVGDRDRETATEYLKLAFAEGYLARDEFEVRISRALRARRVNGLHSALADLPESIAREVERLELAPADAGGGDVLTVFMVLMAIMLVIVVGATLLTGWSFHRQWEQVRQQQEQAQNWQYQQNYATWQQQEQAWIDCVQQQDVNAYCPLPGH